MTEKTLQPEVEPKKVSSKKPVLPLNKLYQFAGGEVTQDPTGRKLNKNGKAGKVRATEFVPNAKYGYRVRPVGSGDAYGFVAESTLTAIK